MKITRILPLVALAILLGSPAKAGIVINLSVGELFQADGTTPIPDGSLIQLVASTTDTSFAAPTVGSFTGNSSDDVVLASFSLDSSTFMSGSFITALPITLSGNLTTGDPLMLRWFPSLTTSSSLIAGTTYGQYRTDMIFDGSDGGWVMPADGTYALNFLTAAGGGSVPDAAGIADLTVTPVPEPSTYGLLGAGTLAMIAFVRRRGKRFLNPQN